MKRVMPSLMASGDFAWVGKQKAAVSESEGSGRQASTWAAVRNCNLKWSVVKEMTSGSVALEFGEALLRPLTLLAMLRGAGLANWEWDW